jgi:broad specificity phosphatase PhoE
MTHFLLIRHGETDWNLEGRWQGQADVPLNQHGRQQAVTIAHVLCCTRIDAVYSSDLQRAWQTALELAQVKKAPLQPDPRLREIHQGEWQGLRIDEIRLRYKHEFLRRNDNALQVAPPGGETALQVRDRALDALNDILMEYPNGAIAVVTHGFVIAVLRAHYAGKPIEEVWGLVPENGEIVELDVHSPS